MSVGGAVAIYAAVVSTVVAAIRVADWDRQRKHRREPPIVVTAKYAYMGFEQGVVGAFVIKVENHADHPLRVTSLGLVLQDDSGQHLHQVAKPPGATLPGPIPAHDSGLTYFREEALERDHGFDKYKPVEAWPRWRLSAHSPRSRSP